VRDQRALDVQKLPWSQNTTPAGLPLFNPETTKWTNGPPLRDPAGQRQGLKLAPTQQFLTRTRSRSPGRSSTPSATSRLRAIQDRRLGSDPGHDRRARAAGKGAIAYLPSGVYVVKQTLKLSRRVLLRRGRDDLDHPELAGRGGRDHDRGSATPTGLTIEHLDMQKKGGNRILRPARAGLLRDLRRPVPEPPQRPALCRRLCCRGLGAQATSASPA